MQIQNGTDIRGLLTGARNGDAGALNELCSLLREQVLRQIVGKLRDRDRSKEIAQDVIVWFVKNYREGIHDENVPALLTAKAFFMMKSHFRAKYALHEVALEAAADMTTDETEEEIEKNLDRDEISRMIATGLERLPETYRAVITRRYFREMSFKEIGAELGLEEENIRQRHARGIAALRKYLCPASEKAKGKKNKDK